MGTFICFECIDCDLYWCFKNNEEGWKRYHEINEAHGGYLIMIDPGETWGSGTSGPEESGNETVSS